ncbi:hypothetical protein H6P81_007130 [Aristolochia fimbriata]|uniref:Gnk2-homologous domain-containing protein n=1 Tax=Aristolochia fimbriata TaxID=158543 RepID=A0AAV7F222_ARIFI|nr:hypothetical protein H6P81_007130 [Aristolochia fimbriata]
MAISFFFSFLSTSFLLQVLIILSSPATLPNLVVPASAHPLYFNCSDGDNFAPSSPFASNLNLLLRSLASAGSTTGFNWGSFGRYPDQVYGLVLCRGDTTPELCRKCIDNATREISLYCPRKRGASAWYDNCRLRYSNTNFSSSVDYGSKFVKGSNEDIMDPDRFYMVLVQMMNDLALAAAADPGRFATKAVDVNGSSKIYGLVQCTPTLPGGNCYRCLQQQISELRTCCDGKVGGRILGGDCNLRHELYLFYNLRRTLPITTSPAH